MESEKIKSEYGPRKRRKRDANEENVGPRKGRWKNRARGVETRSSRALIGKFVKKEFEGFGVFLGKVVSYSAGMYRIDYEDGDFEDLESDEVSAILVDEGSFDDELVCRKKRLDCLISQGDLDMPNKRSESQVHECTKAVDGTEASSDSKLSSEFDCGSKRDPEVDGVQKDFLDGEADSSSDSSEFVQIRDSCSDNEASITPAPAFPQSSGNIGVPEELVHYLLSVYTFLRSFSIQLFLSPFGLDDFVGSLNCTVPNTLMDGIHFALLRALRRHLEMLSSDGAELALKCLRRLDWSLLDTLTWPVYMVEYLLVMGYTKGPAWKGFYADVLDTEYYSLSVTWKLMILQVLCDDVTESAEIRAEIDIRESFEEGTDSNTSPLPEGGPRRVHPRYTKTSASKDLEVLDIISKASHCISLGSEIPKLDADADDVNQDGNSDECRLCGMDGNLLCCDGCPSVYHPRCTGLSKVLIPDGAWFCLECKAKITESTLRIGTGLRGAEIFGTDPYGHTFLGVCNHLLVLKDSCSGGTRSKYYNQNDIPNVLQVLSSSVQHSILYSGICKGILQYWEIPEGLVFSLTERTEAGSDPVDKKEDVTVPTIVSTPSSTENPNLLDAVEGENYASSVTESNIENRVLSDRKNDSLDARMNVTTLDTMKQASLPGCLQKNVVIAQQNSHLTGMRPCERFGTESMMSTGSVNDCPDHSDLTHQSLADKSIVPRKGANGIVLPTKIVGLSMSCKRNEGTHSIDETSKGDNDFLWMGVSFKPQAYVNQYFLGDIAATAAANLAVLNSEENQASATHASSYARKIDSANIAMQVKAFSSACSQFCWPSSEKKLMDVRRERCGWCSACKSYVTSKKGCLLNFAASNAIKGSVKVLTGIRSIRNGEGSIPGIAMYILYMEESLRGLTVLPFLSASYRRKWRKQVEQASTCIALKYLLLELEAHVRIIAFSGDWVKLVDDWSIESSAFKSNTHSVGPSMKRPSGRRNRKQSTLSDIPAVSSEDDFRNVNWWRGGKLSKLVFQKATLPHSIVKKAARQGGSRKISGICYAEGSDIPQRSRKFTWRSAVEMSKNAPQLALQVRYLDSYVRWSDLVRPEQSFYDAKGAETEASAFRNVTICDKKVREGKIRYCLDFGNQKHLPSRVMKNIIEADHNEDGKEKFWFSETYIPLFLIKEYEEKAEKVPLQLNKALHALSKLQRRQLKASRRDIFSYLMYKGDKVDKCSCASCPKDVLLRDAVKCSECEGYCHKNCTISSTVDMKDDVVVTCNQCYWTSDVPLTENIYKPHINQSTPQAQESKMAVAARKDVLHNGYRQQLDSVGKTETHSVMKSPVPSTDSSATMRRKRKALIDPPGSTPDTTVKRGRVASYGIIWKKKKSEETGANFRMNNILQRGAEAIDPSVGPICFLCSEPYNSDLMYLCCQGCQYWYHADAIQLEESQIFDVVGFRCCKCRRKASPACPYKKQDDQNPGKSRGRVSKRRNSIYPEYETTCKQSQGWETITNSAEMIIEEDDPLLFSLQRVEPVTEAVLGIAHEISTAGTSFQVPQKLPVRRHLKSENDADDSLNPSHAEATPLEVNSLMNSKETSQLEWELPIDDPKDELFDYEGVKYENMEFEPQTYFSFAELLATDDDKLDDMDASCDWDTSIVCEMGTRENQELIEPEAAAINKLPCHMCSNTEPAPDLLCEICGICIHSHCSPWVDTDWEQRWRCVNCRDWR